MLTEFEFKHLFDWMRRNPTWVKEHATIRDLYDDNMFMRELLRDLRDHIFDDESVAAIHLRRRIERAVGPE